MIDWFDDYEEEQEKDPTITVGIAYSECSPLWCYDYGDHYHVINGGWDFDKKTGKIFDGSDDRFLDYRIIFPDMSDMNFKHYNDACFAIMEEAQRQNETRLQSNFQGSLRDGPAVRGSTSLGAWLETK